MATRNSLLWVVVLCAAVAVTNRATDYDADRALIDAAAGDSYSYLALAESAPGLPHDTLAFHHSQRIAIPYVIGTIHRLVPVSIPHLFQASVFLFEAAILLVVAGLLNSLAVRGREAGVLLAMLALNPWAFRYYVTFPGMVNDLGFVLGLAIVLRGLLAGGIGTVVAGQLIASLSRQTGLALVPFVVVWIWRDSRAWAKHGVRTRTLVCVAVAACAFGVYVATAGIAAKFSAPSVNGEHLLGIATWIANNFDPAVLGLMLLRMLASVAIPVACFVGIARYAKGAGPTPGLIPLLVFGSVCCWVQPLLAGPEITAGNGERLVGLGLVPVVLALAIRLRDAGGLGVVASAPRLGAIIVLLGLGSLHHVYVNPGIPHPAERSTFAVLYAVACAGVFALVYFRGQGLASTPPGE